MEIIVSRRRFIRNALISTIADVSGGAWGSQQAQVSLPSTAKTIAIPTPDTVLKFNRDSTPRAFAGNTIICHLPAQSALKDAAVTFRDALNSSLVRNKIALTPPDSYHMTIFSGANDRGRSAENWPSDLPLNAEIRQCTKVIRERLANFKLGCSLPIRVVLNQEETLQYPVACSLRMQPIDRAENSKLRLLRDRLAEVYRFHAVDHSFYEFHITMAYQLSPFTPHEQEAYRVLLREHIPRIGAVSSVVELGDPEFCEFDDMYRFRPLAILGT